MEQNTEHQLLGDECGLLSLHMAATPQERGYCRVVKHAASAPPGSTLATVTYQLRSQVNYLNLAKSQFSHL